MYKEGDCVKVSTKSQDVEGILLPSPDEKLVTVKTESGYNLVFEKRNVKSIDFIKKADIIKKEKTDIKKDTKLKNISILHCGGTVASKVDYKTGGVTANFAPEEFLSLYPELKEMVNVESRLVKQMMSENMRFAHYNIMAKEIEKEVKKGVDGVIITHGTDTMHYSSAALAFALEGLNVPVLIVGSQRSSDRGSSDSAQNLFSAITFITNTDFADLGVCMHENTNDERCLILPPTKMRKMHTSRRDAFRPINVKAYASIDYKKKDIKIMNSSFNTDKKRELKLRLFNEDLKIGLLKSHPNMYADEFEVYEKFDGLVLEGTGLGQIPNTVVDEHTKESEKIIKVVKEIASKKMVVMAPQCIYGRIDMDVYSEGRVNIDAGVLGNNLDMTPECAFVKVAWLLSNYKLEEAKELYSKDIRGEIVDRIENSTFLI